MWEIHIHKHTELLRSYQGMRAFDFSWLAIDLVNREERERISNWIDYEGKEDFKEKMGQARKEVKRRNSLLYIGPEDWEVKEQFCYAMQSLFPWYLRFSLVKQNSRIDIGVINLNTESKDEQAAMRARAYAELDKIRLAEHLKATPARRAIKCL